MSSNTIDIHLLDKSPNTLIINYQPLIKSIVYNFHKAGFVKRGDIDDYIQYVNTELLYKIDYIKEKYNGESPFKIYLLVIVRNLCYEKLRKERKYDKEINGDQIEYNEPENVTSNIIIEQELDLLDKLLKTFHRKREKLLLSLKLLFRVKIFESDFEMYKQRIDLFEIEEVLEKTDYCLSLSDKDIYDFITPIFNKFEGKNNSGDTTRKWVSNKLNEIISLMNGDPPRANYDRETIQLLFEKYFEKTKIFYPEL